MHFRPLISALVCCLTLTACAAIRTGEPSETLGPEWRRNAISYSGFREGQDPAKKIYPSQAEVLEDLKILEKKWGLIRSYATNQHSRDILELIRREGLDLKVMLGAYFAEEPGGEAENDKQIQDCIELANAYPDIVIAVNVGNEALINWSLLPVPEVRVMEFVRRVREGVSVPVTVADNYAYWRDHGAELAELLDFVTVHTYPIWERKDIDKALSYTIENIDEVRESLPGKQIVIGEAGWASYAVGNQHVLRAGDEEKQLRYFEELTTWGRKEGIPVFWFEAFDEPWKGDGTEGHWGLFDVSRRPKLAVQDWYPELVTDAPTSPKYSEADLQSGPRIGVAINDEFAPLIGEGGVNVVAGWEGVARVSVSDEGVSGDSSLRLAHNGMDWGGFFLLLDDPFDTKEYSRLSVSMKLPPQVADLEVKLESPGGRGQGVSIRKFENSDLADGWTEFSIPLKTFREPDLRQLVIIGFWHPKDKRDKLVASQILIDNIRFE